MKNISPMTIITLLLLINTACTLYYRPSTDAPGEAMVMWMIWFYSSLTSAIIATLADLIYTKLLEIENYLKKD